MRPATMLALAILAGAPPALDRSRLAARDTVPSDSAIISFETREGTRLSADVSARDGSIAFDLLGQLWLLPAGGGEARALTDAVRDTAEDLDPSFSPDGLKLLFQSDRPGGRALWMMDVSGGTPTRITRERIPYYARAEAAWAPDGQRFVYVRGGALVVRDLRGGAEHPVRLDSVPNGPVSSPSFTPDGHRILFIAGGQRSRVFSVKAEGGKAEALTDSTVAPVIAAVSPLTGVLAFVAPDSIGRAQLWVQQPGARPNRLTAHEDFTRHRIRWTRDGRGLVYSAEGKLWRIATAGGSPPVEIPFVARVRFTRRRPPTYAVELPTPGSVRAARGFDGLALAPDASRIAMLALDSLWVWRPGDSPRAVRVMPRGAHDVAWSPDSRSVAWSGGAPGEEDLFVTDVVTGATRPLTGRPGGEFKPAWSPDGRYVAFLHSAGLFTPARLGVVRVADQGSAQGSSFRDFGPIDGLWIAEQGFVWAPDSRAIVTYANAMLGNDPYPAHFRLVPLDGAPRPLDTRVRAPSFAAWFDSTLTYVESNRLWRVTMQPDGRVASPPLTLGDDPALAASTARDGTVLYLSADGLRLRRPTGRIESLGWPARFRTRSAPPPLVLRNVHIVDGIGATASSRRDVLVAGGRIRRIAAPGAIAVPDGGTAVDAAGRYVMPGLIDLHAHFFDESPEGGFLYHGVTTARDVGSSATRTAALRDAIDAGITPGPRIVIGGFFFHTQAGDGDGATGLTEQAIGDSAALDRAMRIATALGAGYVKHRTFQDWASGTRVVAAAHRAGLPVSGHCVHILPIIAAGIDGKEHSGDCFRDFGPIYSDFTGLYAAAGIWVDPTVGLFAPISLAAADSTVLDRPDIAPWMAPSIRRRYITGTPVATSERILRTALARTARFHAAGVPLVAGTDQAVADGIHWELESLSRSGLSPAEVIAAATSRAATVLGAAHDIGTIEIGKQADLLVLDANPLADVANTRRIWRVVQGGRIVDRDALLRDAPNNRAAALTGVTAPGPHLSPR